MVEIEYRCDKCGRIEKTPKLFYKSNSSLYENGGCMPICKNCLAALFEKYALTFHDRLKAIKRICMIYDLYYNDQIAEPLVKQSSATLNFGDYIKRLNIVQCKGKTFDDTINEGFSFYEDVNGVFDNTNDITQVTTIPKSVKTRWGSGFSDREYATLEEHYKLLKNANPNCDSNQEIFITDLCFIKMQQMNALRNQKSDDYTKLADAYRKTFQQAGLKTIRDSSEAENFTIGITAEMIEKYTPAEFYNDREMFADHDSIGDYITRFMLRPLRNLMTGSHDRDAEFFVKEEGDDDGLDED